MLALLIILSLILRNKKLHHNKITDSHITFLRPNKEQTTFTIELVAGIFSNKFGYSEIRSHGKIHIAEIW